MAELLLSASEGFLPASDAFCSLPNDVQHGMCLLAFKFLQGKISSLDIDFLHTTLREKGISSGKQHQAILDALVYLFRMAGKLNLDGEELSRQLLTTSIWTQSSADLVANLWKERSSKLISSDSASSFLNIGKLVDVQWKVGMAVSSSACKNLSSAFVTMTLKVADPEGDVVTKSFELTLPEFQKFSTQIRDLAHTMETV